jgi:predicted RNase H-like HicB family nuclease
MRVLELPDFYVAAASENEVLYEFKDALLAFLDSYIREGEVPPLPHGTPVRYVALTARRKLPARIRVEGSEKTAGTSSPPLVLA